jgi:hypothetical protein
VRTAAYRGLRRLAEILDQRGGVAGGVTAPTNPPAPQLRRARPAGVTQPNTPALKDMR